MKNGFGLLIPPSMTWEGGNDYDDGDDGFPMEFYFFDDLIVRGIRMIDQKFGVDHDGYLYTTPSSTPTTPTRRTTRQTPTRTLKRLSRRRA